MKRNLFTMMVAFLLSIFSQVIAQRGVGWGIKGGINVSDQVTSGKSGNVDVNNILRYNGGAYFNYFFLDKLAVQSELLISGKGSDWVDPVYDARDLLTYIDLPVLIRYQIFNFLNLHAGPQVGYLLSAKQKDNTSGEVISINDYYKKVDLGMVIGAEVNLSFRINLTVRYAIGLIPSTTDVEYIEPWLNNFFQISAGYRFSGK